jgi:hypothetical protein
MYRCTLVATLKEIASDCEKNAAVGLSYVAHAALNIIRDIGEGGIKSLDIACLADLVTEIANEGYGQTLLAYLHQDAQDCDICQALARHLGHQPA